ncbi:hypothetical protein D3C81_1660080 [compost metagenome]
MAAVFASIENVHSRCYHIDWPIPRQPDTHAANTAVYASNKQMDLAKKDNEKFLSTTYPGNG